MYIHAESSIAFLSMTDEQLEWHDPTGCEGWRVEICTEFGQMTIEGLQEIAYRTGLGHVDLNRGCAEVGQADCMRVYLWICHKLYQLRYITNSHSYETHDTTNVHHEWYGCRDCLMCIAWILTLDPTMVVRLVSFSLDSEFWHLRHECSLDCFINLKPHVEGITQL